MYGRKDIAEILIKSGADINAKAKKHGSTALHVAAANGHSEIILLLLNNGAPVDARNKFGGTPLIAALEERQTESAKLLIRKGANVNASEKTSLIGGRKNALFHAVALLDFDMVRFMISNGASVSHKDVSTLIANRGAFKGRYTGKNNFYREFNKIMGMLKAHVRESANQDQSEPTG